MTSVARLSMKENHEKTNILSITDVSRGSVKDESVLQILCTIGLACSLHHYVIYLKHVLISSLKTP